jgi:hypothetical protein
MQKPTNVLRIETWTLNRNTKNAVVVEKVAVRVEKGKPGAGQFHGSTNFRGTVLSSKPVLGVAKAS